jgi:MscS family membrane protein
MVALGALWFSAQAQVTNDAPTSPAQVVVAGEAAAREFVRSHRTELSFGLNRVEALQANLLGVPRWEYLATLAYLVLAFGFAKGIDVLVKTRLRAWASRTETQWDDVLVGLADGPVKAVVFVILLNVGLQLFDWPRELQAYVSRLGFIGVALSLIYVSLKAVDGVALAWAARLPDDGDRAFQKQFIVLMGKGAKIVIVGVAVLTLLQNLGVNITAILGSVSVLGLALGLAAQDTVSNLFGAVAVFMDRPFKVGDRIKVGSDVDGVVEEMGLRATRVRTADGFLVTIPNKTVGANTVTNVSSRRFIRGVFDYGLVYDLPAERLRRAAALLREIYGTHPKTHEVQVHFNKFGDSALNLNVVWLCKGTDWNAYIAAVEALQLEVKARFDAEALEFAFPTQTVHMRQEQRG